MCLCFSFYLFVILLLQEGWKKTKGFRVFHVSVALIVYIIIVVFFLITFFFLKRGQ